MAVYIPASSTSGAGSYSNVTLGAGTSTVSVAGAGNSSSGLMSGGASTNWANSTSSKITTNGQLHLEGFEPDIVIGDKSMVTWMQKVEQRLSILEPKPELLAKYEALQQAFDHYKTLGALLHGTENDSQD